MQLENNEKITINVPEKHILFAEAVAVLAEQNSIKEFTMEYEPDSFNDNTVAWDRRVRGKARINYRAKDGRGRPSRNLSISFDASVNHVIESNPES